MLTENSGNHNKFSASSIQFQCNGDNWVFFDKIIINSDGKIVGTITVPKFNKTEKVYTGGVYETYYTTDSAIISIFINKVFHSKKTTIRFKGDSNYRDYTLTKNDKKGIKDVIDAYHLKTGIYLTD